MQDGSYCWTVLVLVLVLVRSRFMWQSILLEIP